MDSAYGYSRPEACLPRHRRQYVASVGTGAILKHITRHVTSGGSLVKGATPTKSLIVCFNMVYAGMM